ncbi:4-hydroxybenzoate octaprenyltransferase [Thalassolituus sp. LLYu03]|uniref:4-hydroxybenzoate octaprenyltransferase n=1 Tax=Thalassolituus sp. LLYu03 TaxID=3421656 RepID=UPI003D2BC3BE
MTAFTALLNRHWPQWQDWVAITRIDKPVGSYLLLWPTLWALWVAGKGHPDFSVVLIFIIGVFLMRSAGCVINDFADRKVDGFVKRTAERPMATGRLSEKEALTGFAVLVGLSFLLVLLTNTYTVLLSFGGLALAALYPFMKRHTHLPQVFLGAAFSWAIPMAFAAQSNEVPAVAWLLYAANLSWTVAYDTMYAMVDRDDDMKIGVKSTAILFADLDIAMIGLLQGIAVFCLLSAGSQLQMGWPFWVALVAGSAFLGWLMWSIRGRGRAECFAAFRQSHWFGLMIWAGILLNYLLNPPV